MRLSSVLFFKIVVNCGPNLAMYIVIFFLQAKQLFIGIRLCHLIREQENRPKVFAALCDCISHVHMNVNLHHSRCVHISVIKILPNKNNNNNNKMIKTRQRKICVPLNCVWVKSGKISQQNEKKNLYQLNQMFKAYDSSV